MTPTPQSCKVHKDRSLVVSVSSQRKIRCFAGVIGRRMLPGMPTEPNETDPQGDAVPQQQARDEDRRMRQAGIERFLVSQPAACTHDAEVDACSCKRSRGAVPTASQPDHAAVSASLR